MNEYVRRGTNWVRNDLSGRQKEFCMCWDCIKFEPNRDDKGCDIIKEVLELAKTKNIILPVWECKNFERCQKIENKTTYMEEII